MEQVLKLAENYVVQRVMSHHAPLTHANKALLVTPAIIGLVFVVGSVLVLTGLYMWLETIMPIYEALMVMGGVMFAIAIIMVVFLSILNSIKAKKIQQARQKMTADILAAVQIADNELSQMDFVQNNPKSFVSVVAIMGYMIGQSLKDA